MKIRMTRENMTPGGWAWLGDGWAHKESHRPTRRAWRRHIKAVVRKARSHRAA